MTEHPSPPGPREMVQEHRVIHTYSGIQFEDDSNVLGNCSVCGRQSIWVSPSGVVMHPQCAALDDGLST